MARAQPAFDGARETTWSSPGAALVHKLFAITPEDRRERQPCAGFGGHGRFVFAGRPDNREGLGGALGIAAAASLEIADRALGR